ncbi:MAG TPA: potassium channel family protein, partial [Promineifilum sp.]|nr:potassium channel family protein [Promineifilum sp.]
MKYFPSQLSYFMQRGTSRVRILQLLRFVLLLVLLVIIFSALFHYIMAYEGRSFSWITGFYWVLTVMSTLGFGDITFESDLGRFYSSIVLLSGVIFLLIVLPFTFIEFFYAPWMRVQAENRAPTQLPEKTNGHVILTVLGPVTNNLINKLKSFHY